MKEPSLFIASAQNAAAAQASPSIGNKIVLTGIFPLSTLAACSKWSRRLSADTVVEVGLLRPRVGRPSVISRILSGGGDSSLAAVNAW